MTSIVWSPEALSDLQAIHTYVSADSARYADLVVRRIVAAVEQLGRYPESGRIVPERDDRALREVIVAQHRVVYRTRESLVEVVTVFRSSRQFPQQVI